MRELMTELLNETIEFYGEDPEGRRAVTDTGLCLYERTNGEVRHCAIGRLMTEKGIELTREVEAGWEEVMESYDPEDLLKTKYQELPVAFLDKLQGLHDGEQFWKNGMECGLSERGVRVVRDIREYIREFMDYE